MRFIGFRTILRWVPKITAVAALLLVDTLGAQSYQSSFSPCTYDRARTPVTLAGPVEVDAPSGAASIHFALGPGIGRGDLHFTPVLEGRFAPSLWGKVVTYPPPEAPPFLWADREMAFQAVVAANQAAYNAYTIVSCGGASFIPGFFELLCQNIHGSTLVSNFQLPDGTASTVAGAAPATVLTNRASTVLGDFHYTASTQVSPIPCREDSLATSPDFISMSSRDDLVVGINDPAFPQVALIDTNNPLMPSPNRWILPGRILVVSGGIAVEFAYSYPNFSETYVPFPRSPLMPDGKTYYPLVTARYKLTRILNRFNEAIEFNHSPGGITNFVDYDATWTRDGAPIAVGERIEVRLQPLPASEVTSVPVLGDPRLSAYPKQLASIKVSYVGSGFKGQSSFLIKAYNSWGGTAAQEGDDSFRQNLQPVSIVQESDEQKVDFSYTKVGGTPEDGGQITELQTGSQVPIPVTLLSKVTMPGRNVALDWTPYPWRKNAAGGRADSGVFIPGPPVCLPQFFFGVSTIDDSGRKTLHHRVVPIPDFSQSSLGGWTDRTFYDAIVHPDQSVTVHQFVPPVANSSRMPTATSTTAEAMQTLAFLKHVVKETRFYPQGADWQADLGTGLDATAASSVEQRDRFDLRRVGNPQGTIWGGSVPFTTRSQVMDLDTKVLRWAESAGWDPEKLDWASQIKQSYDKTPLAPFEWLPGGGEAPDPKIYDQSVARVLGPDFAHGWMHRVSGTTAKGMPPVTFSWNEDGTLASQQVGGNDANVVTSFTYNAGTSQQKDVTLTGKDAQGVLGLSGSVGIKNYGYDAHGFLSTIQPLGVAWSVGQTSDAFGRPAIQKDANGLSWTIQWDPEGRLSGIVPGCPNDVETDVSYDSDFLGSTATRGGAEGEWSQFRYDGFGQLILARRSDGTKHSHKAFAFDSMGRKTVETVWLPNDGTEGESTSSVPATRWGFDSRGRIASVLDPNGTLTTFEYKGLKTTQTISPGAPAADKITSIDKDPLGRVAIITNVRAEGDYVTSYTYDEGGRLTGVTQKGDKNTQSRSWTYNHPLKWLTSIDQPESGTTTYSSFDVTGQPEVTNYAGVPVTTKRDSIGRVLSVVSAGTSALLAVDQGFTYDVALEATKSAYGKLVSATDGDVRVEYRYDNEERRLSRLDTTIGSATYVQAFGTDPFARRTSASVDGRVVATTYNNPTGAPVTSTYTGGPVLERVLAKVTGFDPVSWKPVSLSYAGVGASSVFAYRPDQVTFATQAHYLNGGSSPYVQWIYQFDLAGRIRGDGTDSYGYDSLDRLVRAEVQSGDGMTVISQAFAYDPFGNVASSRSVALAGSLPVGVNNFTFSAEDLVQMAATNRLRPGASGVPTAATYDNQGHLTAIAKSVGGSTPVISLQYDALGRVVSLVDGGRTEIYGYTPDGLRARIHEYQGQELMSIKHRIYNDQRQLVSEYEAVVNP